MNPNRPLTRFVRTQPATFRDCPHCDGRGRVVCGDGSGRYSVQFRYQDETRWSAVDYPSARHAWAAARAAEAHDSSCNAHVVGPDGYYYVRVDQEKT